MASARSIFGDTFADIARRLGYTGPLRVARTNTGYIGSPGSPPPSPGTAFLGPPASGGDPYGPPVAPPRPPRWTPPPYHHPLDSWLPVPPATMSASATHGLGYHVTDSDRAHLGYVGTGTGLTQDHDVTRGNTTGFDLPTMTPVDPIPSHPPGGPHWLPPAVRPPASL